MALSRWELNRVNGSRLEKTGLIVLFSLCALYPFYTGGLQSDLIGEIANVALEAVALGLGARYVRHAPRAAVWLVPLCLWLGFASLAGGITLAHSAG
jgi:tryptophan-rich sensory protein